MAVDKDRNLRIISLDPAEMRIEAMVAEKNNPDVFHRILFKTAEVSYLRDLAGSFSAMVLKSGVVIPVALGFDALQALLHEPDFRGGNKLDLTLITGRTVRNIAVPPLSDDFNPAAQKYSGPVQIKMFAEDAHQRRFYYVFSDKVMASYKAAEKRTLIFLKDGHRVDMNDLSYFYANLPLEKFEEQLSRARRDGQKELDLTEITRHRAPLPPGSKPRG